MFVEWGRFGYDVCCAVAQTSRILGRAKIATSTSCPMPVVCDEYLCRDNSLIHILGIERDASIPREFD
jgi:hypothetical protein